MKKGTILLLSLFIAAFFTACDNQPDTINDSGDDLTIAELEVSALKSAESVDEEIDAARYASHMRGMFNPFFRVPHFRFGDHFPPCATVTVENEEFPKTIVIEYGDDCVSRRGITKTGTITITVTDSLSHPGATYTVVYDDLVMGDKVKNMTATYTYEGPNENGNDVVSWTSVGTTQIGDTILVEREVSHSKEWLSGYGTPDISDDQFLLSGGGTITINGTNTFKEEIIDPLYMDRACRFILSGTVEITKNEETMLIDFGDGECDNVAVVTKDGESEEIDLIGECFREGFQRKHHNAHKRKGWW